MPFCAFHVVKGMVIIMKKYILFGAGREGENALRFFGKDRVSFFCDTYKSGREFQEKGIISISELKEIHNDYIVVITSSVVKNVIEIIKELEKNEIPFILFENELCKLLKEDLFLYEKLNQRENFRYQEKYSYPIGLDKAREAGYLSSYFWQDLWAAQKVFRSKPLKHYDIGSRVDGFITHLLSFEQIVILLDIRPLSIKIPNVEFMQCDATNLNSIEDESIMSLSALCSLEHFGLGRYGDPIDPEACFKCFEAIQKKMKKGGKVYISVPIGKEHLEFNAHRVFYAKTIVDAFSSLHLLEFSAAKKEGIVENPSIHQFDNYVEKGGELFGLFMFEKR